MFLKGKNMVEKAEQERAKVQLKEYQLKEQNLDRSMIIAKRRRMEEIKRLTA